MAQKRVLAIHDISCFGKCSLTVALPIISSTGVECTVMPTAVLSTHTGGFEGYTYRELTDDLLPITDHWRTLGLRFDSIYTGFLGSFEQIDIVSRIFDELKEKGTLIVVDPVMADNGELYPIFDAGFPKGMRRLCEKADVILPNITEAVMLLGEEYVEGPYSKDYIEGLLKRLGGIGSKKMILTGVYFDTGHLGAAAYDAESGAVSYSFHEVIQGYYHGTGDVFGSVVVSALMNGSDLTKANEIAVAFTAESIMRTRVSGTDVRFGVNFEEGLGGLIRMIKKGCE
jgi:pyridoxine kinase